MTDSGWRITAGLSGFSAIVMGAVAAHAVADTHLSALAKHASIYQLLHSLLLLWLAGQTGKTFSIARWLILSGIVFFCGSLYLKALTGLPATFAPMGGVSFMAGWLAVAVARKPT